MISATIIDESGIETVIPGKPDVYPWLANGLASKTSGTLEGWGESPTPRAEAVERPQSDGAFAPWQLLVEARIVTIVFHARRATKAALMEFKRYVTSWTKQWLTLVVTEEGFVSHVTGYISEKPEFIKLDETTGTFTLILTCPDPLKYEGRGGDGYGQWNTVSGRYGSDAEGGLLFPAFDQTPRDDVSSSPSRGSSDLAPGPGSDPDSWELANGAYIYNSPNDAGGKGVALPVTALGEPQPEVFGPWATVDPGETVAFSVFAGRNANPDGPLTIETIFYDSARGEISREFIDRVVPGNAGTRTGRVTAPAGARFARFHLVVEGAPSPSGWWGCRNLRFVSPGYGFTARFTEQGLTNSALVVNTGNSPTWPVLEADGPFDRAHWVYDGHVVRWESTVPAGMTLRINSHTGAVEIGGNRVVPSALVNDDFFQLPAGTSAVAFASSHPTKYRVRWLSAWM